MVQVFFNVYDKTKLLVVILRSVSVEDLVSVNDSPSAHFDRYGRNINILTCLWFKVWWKIDLMAPLLKNNTRHS